MFEAARTPPFGKLVAIALLAGIGAALASPWLLPWPSMAPLALLATAGWWRLRRARALAAFAFGFALASLHAAHALALQLPPDWEKREVALRGRIVDLPVHESRRSQFRFRVDDDAAQPAPLRGRLLRLAWYDDDPQQRAALKAGQRWQLRARVRAPRGLRNPGGPDAEKYALAQRLSANGYLRDPQANARLLAPPAGLDAWREAMCERIAAAVTTPGSRFVRALALGDTRGLDDADWDVLRANGLTHLIAISGFHVGLVAGFFALFARGAWWLLPGLGRRVPAVAAASLAAMAGGLLYAAAAGFALPTVRTWLMIAVIAALRLLRRPGHGADALALAVIAVLLADPLALLGAGFWLSFLGVAWLLWCLPAAGEGGWRERLGGFVSAQGVASLGLLPLCVALFGQASLAGPLANLVAVPWWSLIVVPLALIGTGLDSVHAGAGAFAWRWAAACFEPGWPALQGLAGSGLALWWLPEPRWFALPLALLGAFWLLLPRGTPGKALALLLWLPLLWPDRRLPAPGAAELVVIDVGQGLSVLVRTAHHSLLFDAGPAVRDGFDAGERAVVPALHALGVRRLDAAIVSHGDQDHAGGLAAVLRAFPAPLRWGPPGIEGDAVRGLRLQTCEAGREWRWDGVRLRFLHPPAHFPYLRNESSCVLRIDAAHASALLTGDIGEVVERDLVRRASQAPAETLRADVVLVAHHGSGESSDPAFVRATGARYALVSSGHGNRFGHPRPEVSQRWRRAGARVADTAADGALRIALRAPDRAGGGAGLRLESRRQTHPRLWDASRRAPGLSYRPD
ncbi:DNA internalization-related competence protein ComEC/Rec2 [Lysobacter enzymogenes]|uniref:DNA internalization-related competence protein ComEC/Rec2 n=1 Tax=Lysobacter enzymogenes TaxID=69 RepID=UPI001A9792C0|nr:DNA internalization-related competence protein ComEC/Rec2 [Lysobacter enzymogenes]QQP97612.1 DNA internalization-related competence protein ComEC/Rec2 [Lysobacter enzymogenes]